MDFTELAKKTMEMKASDLHLTVGIPPTARINGNLQPAGATPLSSQDILSLTQQMLDEDQMKLLLDKGEIDCSISAASLGRFRVNIFKQRGSYSMAIRVVASKIPSMIELGLPPIIKTLAKKQRGLVLVTGPTGSGKSTTLAAMVNQINQERNCHVLTLEDPIEYLHKHNKSIVNQREIGHDSLGFPNALKSALRQDPDVILVGEMRDLETISTALTAAETGHLVLSTLHTIGAAKTIDRIIDVFPSHQQQQVKVQLASVIEGVVSQQLVSNKDQEGRTAAFEVMIATAAIRNLIREGKTHQIQNSIQTGTQIGMQTMDNSLIHLYHQGTITRETLLSHAIDIESVKRLIGVL
ncbi:MAG: type IV pilus twitching motility protein PilT [Clostridiaceae bacterium]|nr:type IV pilus twitching motility protein PilT [Clostridiaceae bacterium]